MDSKKFTIIVAALTMVFCLLTVVYNFASVPAYGEGAAEAVPIYLPTAHSGQSEISSQSAGSSETSSVSVKGSSQKEVTSKTSEPSKKSSSQALSGPVNINTADKAALVNVKYIGDTLAQAIIDYRNTNGKFKTVDDLDNVKGFGKARIEKIRNEITV